MQTTGKLTGIVRDIQTEKLIVSFMIDSDHCELIGDKLLDINVEIHRKKKSLKANAYFHVLVSKIAAAVHASNNEVKNRLIREYGQYLYIDGEIPTVTIKSKYEDAVLAMEGQHFNPIERNGETVRLGMMRGSHTYNSAEMARLIDGTVNEAKDLGIETLPPKKLKRMKAGWNTEQKTV